MNTLLKADFWLDQEAATQSAVAWYSDHIGQIRAIKTSQWEALLRLGEKAASFEDYHKAVREHLREDLADGRIKYRWASEEMTESFLKELAGAAKPDDSNRTRAFRALAGKGAVSGPGGAARQQVEWWRQIGQARAVVRALVAKIRAERALALEDWTR